MKKKILIAVALVGFGFISAVQAQAEFSTSLSTGVLSQYVTDAGWVFYDDTISQTELVIRHSSGFYGGFVFLTPLGHRPADMAREGNYTVGWSGAINESALNLDVGLTYSDYTDSDMGKLFAQVSTDFDVKGTTLTPFVRVEALKSAQDDGPDGGTYTFVGVKQMWPINTSLKFTHALAVVYDSGVYGGDNGTVGSYQAALSYDLYKGLLVTPSVKFTAPFSIHDEREKEFVCGVAFSYNF